MVEATTGWLETYPVPHATARNTILGLEKQILWRHGTPERIESDNGTHFKNSLINTWAREHGIEWVYHIPYHAPAAGKVERHNALLKTQLKALGGGSFKNWEQHLAKATWLVNTRGSTNRAGPAQAEPLHTIDGDKVPVVHAREYDLWEGLWKKALKTVLQEIQQTPDAQDSDYNDITHDHLCGEGDLSSANEQIRLLSKSVLNKICNAAEKTFYRIPSTEIKTSYVNIKQFPSENFLQFVDRLRSQVERQVQDPVVQAELIKEMAQRNGNGTCRRIILSLPLDPSPSLAQMIEACTKRAELFSASERDPGLTHPKPVAAAAPGARRQPMSSDQLQHIICHHCKRPGHFAKACPENQKHLLIGQ
ncbi:hypothetical protein DUI87_02794 [Hirundo rustica rustica]|uniref:Integrase catalytic domain-containing protein n=1 Tax=Hirundo rustica rustica TaxID=333673 RepID=A0A3M0L9D5_HIRRU|nr:hypothetical protein DUI87_02794 [Hirundo rustica rustica]